MAHEKRLDSLPDVPTLAELGIKGMEVSNWFGIVAPRGTPRAIVDKLNQAITARCRNQIWRSASSRQGT